MRRRRGEDAGEADVPAVPPSGDRNLPARLGIDRADGREAQQLRVLRPYSQALAGAGGGLAAVATLHPLDTLKTRLQAAAGGGGLARLLKGIASREGLGALYSGVVPAAVGNVSCWAFYFHAFHLVKGAVASRVGYNETATHLVAGSAAGLMIAVSTNPIWVIKTRLQLQGLAGNAGESMRAEPYRGFLDGIRSIAREEGPRGLYRGLEPSIWLVSHGAVQFTLYERFKRMLAKKDHGEAYRGTSAFDSLLASTASKLVASVTTYPLQSVRTRMQERGAAPIYQGWFATAFRHVWLTEGWRGLYRGLFTNILRVTPQAAVTFVVYEQILWLCSGES